MHTFDQTSVTMSVALCHWSLCLKGSVVSLGAYGNLAHVSGIDVRESLHGSWPLISACVGAGHGHNLVV